MPYASPDDVQRLIARVPNIGSASTPNAGQITEIIADVSAEVEIHLLSAGFGVPAAAPSSFLRWVGLVVQEGTAAIVLKSAYPESMQAANGGPVIPAYAYYEKKYQDSLKLIDSGNLSVIAAEDDELRVGPSSYFTRNPDVEETLGDIAEPPFKRDMVF